MAYGFPVYCSFCGKEHKEVKHLVSGPTIFICNECVLVAVIANRKVDPNFLRRLPRIKKNATNL